MNDAVKSDGTGTIEVVVSGSTVQSVRISNRWKDRYDPRTLGEKLSELIRDALPTPEGSEPRERWQEKHLPVSSIPGFIAELRAGRAASRRYVERLRAGEVRRQPIATSHTDAHQRVEVSIVAGRFDAIALNPEWAENAPIQSLCESILEALDLRLVEEQEIDPDMAEMQRHYAAARSYFVDK